MNLIVFYFCWSFKATCDIKIINMNEEEKQRAIKIMEKLMEHPITKLFQDYKYDEDPENMSSSTNKNLNDIKSDIIDGKLTFSDWKKLIGLCFTNDKLFKEKEMKYFQIISKECKEIFEKLTQKTTANTFENWCSNVSSLHSAQIDFARHPPGKIFSIAIQLDSFKKIDNEKIIPLSLAEIKALQQALTLIKSADISHGLVNIVTELQPEIKPTNTNELNVELMKLDIKTVRALRDYLKVELEKQGDHYPT